MSFSTYDFFIFFSLFLFFIVASRRWISGQLILLIGSWSFYAIWNFLFLPLLIGSTLVDFVIGQKIEDNYQDKKKCRRFLFVSIFLNIGALVFFKYTRFLTQVCDDVFDLGLPIPDIILPLAISFYTFQTVSYSIDVYRGHIKARRNFIDFALYVSFFPQLVAGPIIRASQFFPQMTKNINFSWENSSWALQRFIWGLFKKLLIADTLAITVNQIYADPSSYSGLQLIAATAMFSLQLYVDFSAYSDLALALARFFGYKIPENFNNPYFARNISEFWKRWHISLTTWFRDYLYIPLGGNKVSTFRWHCNILIVFACSGLWHGANWGYVIWGLFNGVLILISVHLGALFKLPRLVAQFLTVFAIMTSFVFFRSETWEKTTIVFGKIKNFLLNNDVQNNWIELQKSFWICVTICLACWVCHMNWHRFWPKLPSLLRSLIMAIILWLTLAFSPEVYRDFYYFIF